MYACTYNALLAQAQKLSFESKQKESEDIFAHSIEVETMKDLAGNPRFVRIKYPPHR